MDNLIQDYYEDNARKLHRVVDNILRKYGGILDKDKDDFYSLANEVFVVSIRDFNESKGTFDGFLYSNLAKKIITSIRDRNRGKRSNTRPMRNNRGEIIQKNGKVEYEFIPDISIDTPIGNNEDGTIGDLLAGSYSTEQEIIEKRSEIYSEKMMRYLNKLSDLQKEILRLGIAGYSISEIITELRITQKEYTDCNTAIHSYRNVSILF